MKTIEWTFWQLADSAFPAGGFAHSAGLESAWRAGLVSEIGSLETFLRTRILESTHGIVAFLVAAHSGSDSLEQVDRWCDAFLSNHVANRASRAQGRAFLTAAEAAFGIPELGELKERVVDATLSGHQAPLLGRTAALLSLPCGRTVEWFLYTQLRDVVSAAIRLNIIGPLAGQSLISHLGRYVEIQAEQAVNRRVAEATQTSPVLELVATRHDRLYSRLFQS